MRVIVLLWLCSTLVCAQSETNVRISELDQMMKEVMDVVGFPGVALAVIKDGEVIHRANYGYASLEHQVPISDKSTFQLYSLTKPIIAVSIFQYVEDGKLNLEDNIVDHISGLPSSWNTVKIEHLLTHCSGLPDMFGRNPYEFQHLSEQEAKNRIYNLPIIFAPGETYEYNQTNSWLLKEVIETVSGKSLEQHIRQSQFAEAEKSEVYFLSDAREIVKYKTTSYFPWLKGHLTIDLPYVNGPYFLAGNGLHLSLDQFITWDKKFRSNELLKAKTKHLMWEPYTYTDDHKIFSYGWNIHKSELGKGYGFTGSSVTMYRHVPELDLSVIFLANGFENNYSQHLLMDQIIRLVNNHE